MGRLSGTVADKSTGFAGNIIKGIVYMEKKAIAANRAHEINEDAKDVLDAQNGKTHGFIHRTFDYVGDTMMDAINIATGGAARKIFNNTDQKETRLNLKNLKAEKKAGNITKDSSVDDMVKVMLNDEVTARPISREEAAQQVLNGTATDNTEGQGLSGDNGLY